MVSVDSLCASDPGPLIIVTNASSATTLYTLLCALLHSTQIYMGPLYESTCMQELVNKVVLKFFFTNYIYYMYQIDVSSPTSRVVVLVIISRYFRVICLTDYITSHGFVRCAGECHDNVS